MRVAAQREWGRDLTLQIIILWLMFGGFRWQGSGRWTHVPDSERCGPLQIMWSITKSRDSFAAKLSGKH